VTIPGLTLAHRAVALGEEAVTSRVRRIAGSTDRKVVRASGAEELWLRIRGAMSEINSGVSGVVVEERIGGMAGEIVAGIRANPGNGGGRADMMMDRTRNVHGGAASRATGLEWNASGIMEDNHLFVRIFSLAAEAWEIHLESLLLELMAFRKKSETYGKEATQFDMTARMIQVFFDGISICIRIKKRAWAHNGQGQRDR